MSWTNKITSFNLKGLRVTRPDNTLVCVCEKIEDAKLITAAPDMLKALQTFVQRQESGWHINLAWNNDTKEIIKKAIEKATTT